jgi:hypothetical protein
MTRKATMTASEWRLRLAQLCQDSALAEPGEEDAMLRLGHTLLVNLPDPHSALGDHLPPAARFEALLAAGAHDSAAFALVPEAASYIISRAGEGGCIASVMLPGMEEEMTSEGESPALALVSALAAALASCGLDHAVPGPDRAEWVPMVVAPPVRCGAGIGDAEGWQRPRGSLLH